MVVYKGVGLRLPPFFEGLMSIEKTRIRYIASRDIDKIMQAVNALPFKIEVKGAPTFDGKMWRLFFILPESELLDFTNLEIK